MRDNPIRESTTESPIVDLLLAILEAFRRNDIQYCYWKSSRRIQAVLAGESDFDVLIARPQQHVVHRLLLESGFKLFPAVANRSEPSIVSYVGHNDANGNLIHIHLHLRLMVGEKLLKNYRLPWEAIILDRAVSHPTMPVRMLDPASEALLLIVRASLELHRYDPVTLRHWQVTRDKFESDRASLATRVDRAELYDIAVQLVSRDMGELIADALHNGRPLETQHRLRWKVRKALATYRLYNAIEARTRSIARVLLWVIGGLNNRFLHAPRPWRRRAPGGGILVALLGVDGSGKSTVMNAVRIWLHDEIDVLPIYFGTGDGRLSWPLLPLKALMPFVTRLVRSKPRGSSHGNVSNGTPGIVYSLLLAVWATVLAVEKRLKLTTAHRGVGRGLVVIADRYPQDENVHYNDGPLLPRLGNVPKWLRRFEARAYASARRLPPDLVIKLEAPPELLAEREPSMDINVIRQRVVDLQKLKFPGADVVPVNASQPLSEVLRAVKCEIWHRL
jgi:hypothetical protein